MITTIAGTGISGSSGDNGAPTSAQLSRWRQLNTPYLSIPLFRPHSLEATVSNSHLCLTHLSLSSLSFLTPRHFHPYNTTTTTSPRGISLAPNKDLYIADYGNNIIRKISATTNIITTFASGSADGATRLQSPSGVAVGNNGNMVYIADSGNAVVR